MLIDSMTVPFATFDELPNHIKVWLRETGQDDLNKWVQKPIPALDNRSILEVASDSDGEQRLAQFCMKVKSLYR